MRNKKLSFVFPLVVIMALLMSLVGTHTVLADDSAPPTPTEAPTEETPSTEEPTGNSQTETTTDSEPSETPVVEESLPEILEQLPDETEIVILDESGEAMPMVTTEASAVYVAGDPQWCMAGYTPADDPAGGTYCTAKFTKFTGVGGLIEELTNGLGIDAGPGTIYISYDYDTAAAGDDIDHITFDYGDVSLTDLVVQGGWDFAQNKVVGTSTISLGFGFSLEFLDWGGHGTPGSLTLKDIIITNGNGLFVGDYSDYTTADVALENVDVIDTEYGAYIETEGNVEITDSGFNNSKDDGLFVYSYLGDITLTRVWSEDNFGDGAYLETCDCGSGNIFVESSAFVKNGGRGLVSYASGNITIKNIYAELNEIGGVELDNCAGFFFSSCTNTNPATITMSGTNIIKDNGGNPIPFMGGPYASVGLWVISVGNVSIDGAKVTGNGAGDIGGGAFFFSENGELSISNSIFNDNCTTFECDFLGFGMLALTSSGSDTTLNGVTANGNGNGDGSTFNSDLSIGAILMTGGNAFVKKSTFSNNCNMGSCSGGGIWVMSDGDTYFNFVTADNNGPATGGGGAMIMSNGNADVYCSTFTNHASGIGLVVDVPGGSTASLNGVTFSGNAIDFEPPTSGGAFVENPFDCNPVTGTGSGSGSGTGKGKTNLPALPLNIVNVNKGSTVVLDCEKFSGTKLILENGNNLVIPCPMEGSASLTDHSQDDLPGSLPDGTTFKSAFVSAFSDEVSANGKLDKYVLISFVIPEGVDPSALVILFWDGAQWVEVKGAFVRNEDGTSYFEAYVDYAGIFVLAQK